MYSTPNEFGQFLLMSRHVIKYQKIIDCLKRDLEKVKVNGFALEFVKYQTDTICLEAVKEEGWTLKNNRHIRY